MVLGLFIMYIMMSIRIVGKNIRIRKGDEKFYQGTERQISRSWRGHNVESENIKETLCISTIYDKMITEGRYAKPSSIIPATIGGTLPVVTNKEGITVLLSDNKALLKNAIYFGNDSGIVLANALNYRLGVQSIGS
jgi:hypothetical protein